MPALNFQKQFARAVKNGTKKQTIRAYRKNPIKEGDVLYLYTGMKTKNCIKLKEVVCKQTKQFAMKWDGIFINGKQLHWKQRIKLAKDDGFKCEDDFLDFFDDFFEGQIIYW